MRQRRANIRSAVKNAPEKDAFFLSSKTLDTVTLL